MTKPGKLGQLFLEKQLLTDAQLGELLQQPPADGTSLGTLAVRRGWVTAERLLEVLSEHYRMPAVRLREMTLEPDALALVPAKVAYHCTLIPVRVTKTTLVVAIANPQDVRALDEVRLVLQGRLVVEALLATEADIQEALKAHYGLGADMPAPSRGAKPAAKGALSKAEDGLEDLEQMAGDASVIRLVNQLILEAHARGATDIHLEPHRGTLHLRYRVDGMLHNMEVSSVMKQLYPAIVSRVKVLSNLNIVERRLPQDGRASVKIGEDKLDLRVSVLPTPAGESIVVRILPNKRLLSLRDLGFREEDVQLLGRILKKPHGMILITGPTGSGKSTTLYACLNTIDTSERKIITIEDPIEYEMENVTQVQVQPNIGLTFAQGLRSMLRHDPDVMMVGEIRDVETAELAVRIALTGHLVFSTVHTNDAASAVTRLMEMGLDPYLIASSVECVIGQRLVRSLCTKCKQAAPGPGGQGEMAYQAKGCAACHQSGYLGRSAIYEFFLVTQEIKELLLKRASADAIRQKVVELGMRTMREDGWEKVRQGLTTLDEVLRVTQDDT
jgi:type II secretory ATPase GspE/PulE/Tfp pilus assembly ATPase PilB-like protein